MTSKNNISDELLASFIDGNTSDEQTIEINKILASNPSAFNDFLLAAKATFFSEEIDHGNLSHPSNLGIAASSTSLLAGGIGLAGLASHLHETLPMVAATENNSISSDRLHPHSDSINEHNNINTHHMANPNQQGEINSIQQQYSDTCAIKSQQIILNDFGIPLTEDQLVHESIDNGWYDGNGTSMADIGKLLNDHNIPTTQTVNANVYNLVSELAQGHKVIVGVDADELWNKGIMTTAKDLFIGDTPNHALIVAGIDTTDPNHVQVILTDPGSGDYCKSYPLDQFMDAWQDSKCFMTSTTIPAPSEYNPEMINFDYNAGHISNVGDLSYQDIADKIITNPTEASGDYMTHSIDHKIFDETYPDLHHPIHSIENPHFLHPDSDPLVHHNIIDPFHQETTMPDSLNSHDDINDFSDHNMDSNI